MFFRMIVISGILWTFEIVSYIFHTEEESIIKTIFQKEKNDENFIDLIVCSSGILILFVTIFKADVIGKIHNK